MTMRIFLHRISVPATDNRLVKPTVHRGRRRPSDEYIAFLELEAPLLRIALDRQGFREPDTCTWWLVSGAVYLSAWRLDAANLLKATLDLLSGAQVVRERRSIRVVHAGAFWNEDNRVHLGAWGAVDVRAADPRIELTITESLPPDGWKPSGKRRLEGRRNATAAWRGVEGTGRRQPSERESRRTPYNLPVSAHLGSASFERGTAWRSLI